MVRLDLKDAFIDGEVDFYSILEGYFVTAAIGLYWCFRTENSTKQHLIPGDLRNKQ